MGPSALVSIVIPAYKATFLEAALRSAFAQDYPAVEIVIGDDCPTAAVEEIVERLRTESPWPINYVRNAIQLREAPNVTQCIRRAKGEYIKFLYDDDELLPACVRRQVETFEAYPGLSLVTARRQLIDEHGQTLPDTYATRFPFAESMRVHGADLTSFLGDYTYNFIGEPTSVLCRRVDLLGFGDSIFGLAGQHISWLGDLAIYAKLMRQGDIAMLDDTLTRYRVSAHQSSQGGRDDSTGPEAFHNLFRRLLRELDWVRPLGENTHVRVVPLALTRVHQSYELMEQSYNLGAWLHEVLPGYAQPDFKRWLQGRQLGHLRQAKVDTYVREQGGGPALLLVINDLDNDEPRMLRSLQSIDRQMPLLTNATLVILSSRPDVGTGQVEDRFYWVNSDPAKRAGHLNQLISELQFDWLLSFDAGTVINPDALTVTLLELMGKPACPAIFCDEAYRDPHGGMWPLLRANFNLDQLLSVPVAMAGHWIFQRSALLAMDGFDGDLPSALELDVILRLIEAGQQGFGHISEPLLICEPQPLRSCEDEREALLRHLRRRGYSAAQVSESSARHYLIDYGHDSPSVAVLIHVQGSLETLKRCVATVLMITGYANYQLVLVETEHTTEDLRQWMDALANEAQGKVLSVRSQNPLSLNVALNGAVEGVSSDYLVFLDPACVIVEEQWLNLLLDQALRPEVGAVGARRVERGERLQDAGFRLGLGGPADTALLSREEGPVEYVQVQRNALAVSRMCLAISRTIFRQVGGFDETRFQQSWADVDLCLKLHWAGYLNVWTPRAWVALTEPVRRMLPAMQTDEQAMYEQWGASLGRDPSVSHLHALRGNGFDFDPDPQITWRPLAFAGLPVVIGGGQAGSADVRIVEPLEALRHAGMLEGGLTPHPLKVSEWLRLVPGAVVLPFSQAGDFGLEAVRDQLSPCRICDMGTARDSEVNIPHLPQALARFDKVLVATEAQAKRVAGSHPNIEVLPSYLPPSLWRELASSPKDRATVRVGVVCGAGGSSDTELLAALFEQFCGRVEWVVYGELPVQLRPWVNEFQPTVAPHRYPQMLSRLGLDIAVVAMIEAFSASADSERRILEHAACGTAVIASQPSRWPIAEVPHRLEAFREALQAWLDNPAQRESAARHSHLRVMSEGLLEGQQAERWLEAWAPLMT